MSFIKKVVVKSKQLSNGYVLRNPSDLLDLEYIRERRKHDFRHRYDILPGDMVFDLGGHKGEWCNKISCAAGETTIKNHTGLDLFESSYNSVYVEGTK